MAVVTPKQKPEPSSISTLTIGCFLELFCQPLFLFGNGHVAVVQQNSIFGFPQGTDFPVLVDIITLFHVFQYFVVRSRPAFCFQLVVSAPGADVGRGGYENLQFGIREHGGTYIAAIHHDTLVFAHLLLLLYQRLSDERNGGNISYLLDEKEVASPIIAVPDCLIAMNTPSLLKFQDKVKEGGLVIINSSLISEKCNRDDVRVYYVEANKVAHEVGNDKASNLVVLGAYIKLSGAFPKQVMLDTIAKVFASKPQFIPSNQACFEAGYNLF